MLITHTTTHINGTMLIDNSSNSEYKLKSIYNILIKLNRAIIIFLFTKWHKRYLCAR
jgi:hypothetical protein